MRNFPLSLFLPPVVALLLVIVIYFLLVNKTSQKTAFQRLSLLILTFSILLNFIWEMAQMPLYKGMSFNTQDTLFCFLAAIADTVMVLLIYFGFALLLKNALWIQNLSAKKVVIVMLIGGIGAVLAEIRHTTEGNWAYANSMPIVPLVNAGLSPVLQFLMLPSLIYYMSWQFLNRKS